MSPTRIVWAVLLAITCLGLTAAGCGVADDAASPSTTVQEEQPVVVPISDDACLACHTDFSEATADEDPKEFSHDLHIAQRIACATCHSSVGHSGTPAPPDRAVCDDCHRVAMPHPAGYGTAHGEQVREEGGEVCDRCHNVYLHCQECHGLQMPHPADWEHKHGEIAHPQMQTCDTCHKKGFCLQCHPVEMPHPQEWTRTHGFATVEQGSEMCTTCHEPELCTACHGMPMPHPADWGTAHQVVAREKRGECLLCHVADDCVECHTIHDTHVSGGGG